MKATPQAQIVHESETQRQHARFSLPARVICAGKEYEMKDLSSGGIALRNFEGNLARGKQVPMDLKLPFGAFSLGLNLTAEVRHNEGKVLGCRFTSLESEQVSFINHALKSYMAGDILASGNILSVAARNNFTKPRPYANTNAAPGLRRQLPGLFLVAVMGFLILAFLFGNLHNRMFIVKAGDAAVTGPFVSVRAGVEGIFDSRLDPGLTLVQKNQVIGTISPASGGNTAVLSPCDCYIARKYVSEGEMVGRGQQIVSLMPIDAKPWVIAEVDPADGKRITAQTHVAVSVFGSQIPYSGRVVSMESTLSGTRQGSETQVLAKIQLDQKLPVNFVNRLATVTFENQQPWF
jgi:mannuronan synthase